MFQRVYWNGGGVWVRSQVKMQTLDLEPAESSGDELALTQSFDLGLGGKNMFFAGYTWDWLRHVDSESFPKTGAIKLGFGFQGGIGAMGVVWENAWRFHADVS